MRVGCYNQPRYGGYSSVAERRSVAADVVGSNPTSRPKSIFPPQSILPSRCLHSRAFHRCASCEIRALPRTSAYSPATSLAPSAPQLFVGTSGWAYPTWKPAFYPPDVSAKSFLTYYASQLTSVEVNYTFRALPSHSQLEGWLAATPPGFRFSFKAPQRITHFARLRDCEGLVESFLTALAPMRAGKLGPLLFQLPPNFAANRDLLARFLEIPSFRQTHAALAFEFRHTSWFTEEIFALLREHSAALCVAESDNLATPDIQTASFRCYRLRRSGGYTEAELDALARQFAALAHDGEVFVFLKHEDEPTGALNAVALQRRAAQIANPQEARG
jgi:uncharacterized protein YecE (DUF72 family)